MVGVVNGSLSIWFRNVPLFRDICNTSCGMAERGAGLNPDDSKTCEPEAHVPNTRLALQGSPVLVGTWLDEHINGFLAGIASVAHRMVWNSRVLVDFRVAHKRVKL